MIICVCKVRDWRIQTQHSVLNVTMPKTTLRAISGFFGYPFYIFQYRLDYSVERALGKPSRRIEKNINPLNAELNPTCSLLALLAHHFLHVSSVRVKSLTLRLLMSYIYIYIYIYMERLFLMFLDHTQLRSTVGRTPLDE